MRFLVLFLLATLTLHCASSQATEGTEETNEVRTTIRVENRSFYDHSVFVVRSGQRRRLGSITGGATRTFTIPSYLVEGSGVLRFQADPVGSSRAPISQEISVFPGDQVFLIIPAR